MELSSRAQKRLSQVESADDARARLKDAEERYEEVEGEIQELEGEKHDLDDECEDLEDIIPYLVAMEADPEFQEKQALLAAINNPNQARFELDNTPQREEETP